MDIKDTKYIRENFITKKIRNRLFILNTKNGVTIELNSTGIFLWNKLSEKTSKKELLKSLCEVYDTTSSEASEDVDKFIKLGIKQKIIKSTH